MHTPVGIPERKAAIAASVLAVVVISVDLWHATTITAWERAGLALVSLAAYALAARGDRRRMGLTLGPDQGWRWWGKATIALGAIVGVFILAALLVLWLLGRRLNVPGFSTIAEFWWFMRHACIEAPLTEEAIYRFALCVPLVRVVGPRVTIVVSGVCFAALHFRYGNPGPDNFIAGFVLAWAFLRSGTIVVPIGLHALGNLCVALFLLVKGG